MSSNRETRVVKNTAILYLRLIITMAISLYTSRVVLNVLGIDDFGLYNVVVGFISMFAVLSDSLSTAYSRFMTVSLGKGDLLLQKKVFSTSVNAQLILSLGLFVIIEMAGLWFVNQKINVPVERVGAIYTIFQIAVFSFLFSIFRVTFIALIIAHEHASAYAAISVCEAVMKLIAVLCLAHFATTDQLASYVFLILIITIIVTLTSVTYCLFRFQECRYQLAFDYQLLKEMLGFSGWTLFGRGALVFSGHSISVVLNMFFGVGVNAARGIASQVDGATRQFAYNVMMAVHPQIIKSYAIGDKQYMYTLINKGTKYACFVMLLYSIPLICETEMILKMWLGLAPEGATLFTRLALIEAFFHVMTITLNTSLQASGHIRNYQIVTGILLILTVILSYLSFIMGLPAVFAYIVTIFINIVIVGVSLCFAKKEVGLCVRRFIKEVIGRSVFVVLLASIIPVVMIQINPPSLSRFIMVVLICIVATTISILIFGLNSSERLLIKKAIKNRVISYRNMS